MKLWSNCGLKIKILQNSKICKASKIYKINCGYTIIPLFLGIREHIYNACDAYEYHKIVEKSWIIKLIINSIDLSTKKSWNNRGAAKPTM